MKYLIGLLCALPFLIAYKVNAQKSSESYVNELTFLTGAGFPYDRLVNSSDRVTITYKKIDDDNVSCKVQVKSNDLSFTKDEVVVSVKDFKNDALKACLDRDSAKGMLKHFKS